MLAMDTHAFTNLLIERPAEHSGLPEDDHYETIGQFYEAIEEALVRLSEALGEEALFCGDPARQAFVASFLSSFLLFSRGESANIVRGFVWYAVLPYLGVAVLSMRGRRRMKPL